MKKNKSILLIIFLLISTLGISQNGEKEYEEYYDNGQLAVIGNTIDGKESGEFKLYNENGQLKQIGNFKEGMPNGEWKTYYETGKLELIVNFADGINSGESKEYYYNGLEKATGSYINGKETGEWKAYHENGQLAAIGKFNEATKVGVWNYYTDTGELKESKTYFDGNPSENYPPIQKYLDKIIGEKFVSLTTYEKEEMVSQIITKNSFTEIIKDDDINKTVISDINWQLFSSVFTYSISETKKIIECEFKFVDDLTFTYYYKNGEVAYTSEEDAFTFYIYAKDEQDVLKIIADWKKSKE